jgi:hypothetical protein
MGHDLFGKFRGLTDGIVGNSDYLPLIRSVMTSSIITQSCLAIKTGINKHRISRIFINKKLESEELQAIFIALGIDMHRAMLAVLVLRDWQRYFDNGLMVAALLTKMLPDDLRDARNGEIEQLLPATIANVSKQLAARIAENDADIARRRLEINFWPNAAVRT